jgi:hypothetical protein
MPSNNLMYEKNNNMQSFTPRMTPMSEIERGIFQRNQFPPAPPAHHQHNIQQFFQNFSGNQQQLRLDAYNLAIEQQRMQETFAYPTREQLHQHTSEILRNAILRNREQQYHDENHQQ